MRVKFEVNKSALRQQFDRAREDVEAETRERLEKIADDAIDLSMPFVDTGAYITSWAFVVGAGRPRGKSSHGRLRRRKAGYRGDQFGATGRSQLQQDLAKVDLMNTTALFISNGAPHAEIVEYKHNYRVFEQLVIRNG